MGAIRWITGSLSVLAVGGLVACDDAGSEPSDTYDWQLPRGFPTPSAPADNPMSDAVVELGRRLFYDTRLSGNGTQACASCHLQASAFAEPLVHSVGSTGQDHFRNAMSLTNVAYNTTQTWSNHLLDTLEAQALIPMFGEDPVELGLAGMEAELVGRFEAHDDYPGWFAEAFPAAGGEVSLDTITKAIAAFERTLISGTSAYDRFFYQGDSTALSEAARRGLSLFSSERLECFHCHGNFNFSDTVFHADTPFQEIAFHNNALYNVDGAGAYPAVDRGLFDVTGKPADMGRFKAPTLRNIALTAPYMHDGSVATLDAAIDHYMAGGRTIPVGEDHAGDGSASPLKSSFMKGFTLTDAERADLIAFLESLTDTAFTSDPRFADPW